MSEQVPLFSYGKIREQHAARASLITNNDISTAPVHIPQFVRPEFLQSWQNAISCDAPTMSKSLCAETQLALSPISRQSIWELQSGIMLRLLETITGKQGLLPDGHGIFSRFWQPPVIHCGPANWHDSDTGLQGAINLLLLLNGDALILNHQNNTIDLNQLPNHQGVLQLLYFSHVKVTQ
jgi:hypothetical protein